MCNGEWAGRLKQTDAASVYLPAEKLEQLKLVGDPFLFSDGYLTTLKRRLGIFSHRQSNNTVSFTQMLDVKLKEQRGHYLVLARLSCPWHHYSLYTLIMSSFLSNETSWAVKWRKLGYVQLGPKVGLRVT